MKSNYRIFTAVFLSAIMTAAAPLTVCGAEVFSAGESFSDGTDWVLPINFIILKSCLNLEINNVLFMTDKGHMRHRSL